MIGFVKAPPTRYVIHHQNGRVRREGSGLSFFYYAPTSTIVSVPLNSADVPFAFAEVTADFQEVTLQGQLTYRIRDPQRAAAMLDFSISALGAANSDDPAKLPDRLVQEAQTRTRAVVQRLSLREVLVGSEAIVSEVVAALRASEAATMLGAEILNLVLVSIRPTPDMSRALEAEAREALQRRADEAIYERRNAAVESERRIRESELNTEIAVQEKQRQIRETQVAADIAVERQRSDLIDTRVQNDRKDADARAYGLAAVLEPLRQTDWRTLMAAGVGGGVDSGQMIALAFRDLADNAGKIGELNISPDLLNTLLTSTRKG
jgi:regulator of protease activity HflC (stomatin/prohibitin superfamily)